MSLLLLVDSVKCDSTMLGITAAIFGIQGNEYKKTSQSAEEGRARC